MRKKLYLLCAALTAISIGALVACGNNNGGGNDPVPLSTPTISLNRNIVSWNEIEHATGYEVYVDDSLAESVTQTDYTIRVTAIGVYDIKVRATTTEKGYTASAFSTVVSYVLNSQEAPPSNVKLDKPVLTLTGNVVSWGAIDRATGYDVYIDGVKKTTVTATEYTIALSEDGAYSIAVAAVTTASGYTQSDLSVAVVYIINSAAEPLNKPALNANGDVVSWTAVEHAAAYAIYIDDEFATNSNETSYTVTGISAGAHTVAVVAIADNSGDYKNSEKSVAVECTVKKVAERLELVSAPELTEYFVGGGVTELDLTGFAARVAYSNADPEPIALTVNDIASDYDLGVAGRYEIEFEKDGIYGAAFRIYVTERSAADVNAARVVNLWTYSGDGNNNGTGTWTAPASYKLYDELDFTPVTAVTAGGTTLTLTGDAVPTAELDVGETLVKLSDGTHTAYVNVVVAYGIDSAGAWYSMADKLDGYYILTKDIDFSAGGKQIGNAPLNMTWNNAEHTQANTITIDRSGVGDPESLGVAFTGTLDGAGYMVSNFDLKKGGYSYWQRYLGCGSAMFGYVGKSGVIKNLMLSGVTVRGMDYSSLLVGYNEGSVENITVEFNCVVSNMYSHGAILSAYNYGTVRNVVSYISGGLRNGSATTLDMIRSDGDYSGEIAVNGYICDSSDLTSVLGEGWRYLEGHGTVYCTDTFRIVLEQDDVWYANVPFKATLLMADPDVGRQVIYCWNSGNNGEVSVVGVVKNGNIVTFMLKKTALATGAAASIQFRFTDNNTYCCKIAGTVGEPYVCRIEDGTSNGFEAVTGSKINCKSVPVKLVYTDGSESSGNPDGYVERTYDPTETNVAQDVTFYKQVGGEYLYAVISVTPKEATVDYVTEITITKKAGAQRITYGASGTIDFDAYLEFTFVMNSGGTQAVTAAEKGIVASEYKAGKHTVTFSYENDIAYTAEGEIELDIWYVVNSVSDFDSINDNLSGYYVLGGNLDFGNTMHSIGCAPLSDKDGVALDLADGMHTGVAFTGKFDGAGYTLSGFKSEFVAGFDGDKFGRTLFNYIGVGGEVYDFTVSGFVVGSTNFTAFVAACNRGTVRDITVTGGSIYANYRAAGAIVSHNYGTVSGCSCDITTDTSSGDASNTLDLVGENHGAVEN